MALAGKVVAITGASRGIGRACAEAFARSGSRLALCAASRAPALPVGAQGFGARCDISDAREVALWFSEIAQRLGDIDVQKIHERPQP